jgi:hypothetical protein
VGRAKTCRTPASLPGLPLALLGQGGSPARRQFGASKTFTGGMTVIGLRSSALLTVVRRRRGTPFSAW